MAARMYHNSKKIAKFTLCGIDKQKKIYEKQKQTFEGSEYTASSNNQNFLSE